MCVVFTKLLHHLNIIKEAADEFSGFFLKKQGGFSNSLTGLIVFIRHSNKKSGINCRKNGDNRGDDIDFF